MSLGTAPLHRNLKIALLVAAAAALTMLLSQCRMVSDAIAPGSGAAVAADSKKSGDCLRDCQNQSDAAKTAEIALHQANVQACNNDPVCLTNEDNRHEAAMDAINAARLQCMNECHHQGAGQGGR